MSNSTLPVKGKGNAWAYGAGGDEAEQLLNKVREHEFLCNKQTISDVSLKIVWRIVCTLRRPVSIPRRFVLFSYNLICSLDKNMIPTKLKYRNQGSSPSPDVILLENAVTVKGTICLNRPHCRHVHPIMTRWRDGGGVVCQQPYVDASQHKLFSISQSSQFSVGYESAQCVCFTIT